VRFEGANGLNGLRVGLALEPAAVPGAEYEIAIAAVILPFASERDHEPLKTRALLYRYIDGFTPWAHNC
jgi:hypothetical protein